MTYAAEKGEPVADRRERIAVAAMQGLLTAAAMDRKPFLYTDIAADAVNMADALIAWLDRSAE